MCCGVPVGKDSREWWLNKGENIQGKFFLQTSTKYSLNMTWLNQSSPDVCQCQHLWDIKLLLWVCSRQKSSKSKRFGGKNVNQSYHDDEEVKDTHPAQLALNQGHQVLEDNEVYVRSNTSLLVGRDNASFVWAQPFILWCILFCILLFILN